jgi:hypothetical protein
MLTQIINNKRRVPMMIFERTPSREYTKDEAEDLLFVLVALDAAVLVVEAAPPLPETDVQFVKGQEELVMRVRLE